MKKYILIFFLLDILFCKGQNSDSEDTTCSCINIKTENLEGVVFGKFCLENRFPNTIRWTPKKEDVNIAEILVKKYILKQVKNNGLINQGGLDPIIHMNFDKYFRQYLGYINKQGDSIIYINCIWINYTNEQDDYKQYWFDVCSSGSYFWQIEVNINKKKCFNYSVGGSIYPNYRRKEIDKIIMFFHKFRCNAGNVSN